MDRRWLGHGAAFWVIVAVVGVALVLFVVVAIQGAMKI
jgi:hypothetical protein